MSQFPIMIRDYLEYGSNTYYDNVQLIVDLRLKGTHQLVDHSSMVTVERYKSSYIVNKT